MRSRIRLLVLAVAVIATACSVTPADMRPPTSPDPLHSAHEASSGPPSPTRAAGTTSAETERPIGDHLPAELDGVELHTFAVMQEVTERLAENVGIRSEDLELAYASEHGARFIQMAAIRVPSAPVDELLEAFPTAAFPPGEGAAEVTQAAIGGERVTAVTDPSSATRLGTYYLVTRDDVLIVVQAFTADDAEDAIRALPG